MSLLKQKLIEYNSIKEGTRESQDCYRDLCNLYNSAGHTPKIRSTCYCNKSANLRVISHAVGS